MAVTIRFVALTLVLLLAACDRPDSEVNFATPAQAPLSSNIRGGYDPTDSRFKTTHSFVLQIPNAEIEKLQQKHLGECARIKCKVLNANLYRNLDRSTSAQLSVRVPPEVYSAFAAMLVAPPATLISHSEAHDDWSQPVVDVERRLKAKYALRDRLSALLQDPGTKNPADIVAIEKELAQVQSAIETAEAQNEQLRALTDAIRVDISYRGFSAQIAGLDLSPVTSAANAVGQTLVISAAALVWFLALAAPWLPLVALLLWGVRRYFRRRSRPAPLPRS